MSKTESKEAPKTYAEIVIEVGNKLAEDKDFVGLDEKVTVKYLKDFGSFKKNAKRRMGLFKAKTFEKMGIVKISN